ncbi:DUF4089 domain-containing protein, partial [Synechococcus sp. H70.1]|uniref:DUF4089 domain-containing protein n=1 Tax=Synechococcus sp. H70.1 TaxID=2964527 RepID=UPI0039C68BA9
SDAFCCFLQAGLWYFFPRRHLEPLQPWDPETYVDSMAQLLQLSLHSDHRAGVIENLARFLPLAQQVLEFPLPPTVEPDPTFNPQP